MSGVTSDRKSDGVYLKAVSKLGGPIQAPRSNISQVAAQAQHSAHLGPGTLLGDLLLCSNNKWDKEDSETEYEEWSGRRT